VVGIYSLDVQRDRVGMTIILDDKASREIRVALRDIVPHGRSIRLPAELNTILVVIVVRLERGPILVDERLPP
jgi:hypothetical protein